MFLGDTSSYVLFMGIVSYQCQACRLSLGLDVSISIRTF